MIKTTDSCSFREIEVDDSDLPSVDYLTYRNLCIKQLVLQREMTLEQIGAQFFPPLAPNSITAIIQKFGISADRKFKWWKPSQIEDLKKYYPTKSRAWLKNYFGVGWGAILHQANKYGLKRETYREWKTSEINYIKENWDKKSLTEMASAIPHKAHTINKMGKKLGLGGQYNKKKPSEFTERQITILKSNIDKLPLQRIAKLMGREYCAVHRKAQELGLKRERK